MPKVKKHKLQTKELKLHMDRVSIKG